MPGYQFSHADSQLITNAGGVGLYLKNYVNFNVMNDITLSILSTENLWIKIKCKKTYDFCGCSSSCFKLDNLYQ